MRKFRAALPILSPKIPWKIPTVIISLTLLLWNRRSRIMFQGTPWLRTFLLTLKGRASRRRRRFFPSFIRLTNRGISRVRLTLLILFSGLALILLFQLWTRLFRRPRRRVKSVVFRKLLSTLIRLCRKNMFASWIPFKNIQ